ncbi:50S ribosomal protein L21 [Acaryochloris sp. IP29b_bin.137]|uniref:50S ribosomal protein L21 n=1 Tax=Acaryochloris sp. IP29b_bin.137 TaxID=2969217 RepID=UPI0026063F0A|nr:50S ribosomal protein L21 [Acaryochloris sp. IP29b_bin.137]
MTFAIIETGGKQLRVEPGRFYDVDRLPNDADTTLSLDQVLLVHDGKEVTIGQPWVKGATVEVTVMQHRRDRKIIVYKMQPKKKTRKKRGHRQELTRLMVDAIHLDGKAIGEAKAKKTAKSTKSKPKPDPEDAAVAVEAEVVAD